MLYDIEIEYTININLLFHFTFVVTTNIVIFKQHVE